ncbi:MAG: WbqC family protein [Candidatus Eremiobacteraeota bacterium]|nr:WbqC family protein [Candidatus Eremiobacteraeota bacterium]
MRLGIMQPYFFPNLGHFALIAHTDRWIVFDITQYTPKSWMTRNRVLKLEGGWSYINLPVCDSSRSQRIYEVRVNEPAAAQAKLLGALSHYRKRAPNSSAVEEIVRECFRSSEDSLVAINARSLRIVCEYLGIPFHYDICSTMGLELPDRAGPGGWAPRIAAAVGASEYINPIGGRELFDPLEFSSRGVRLAFLEPPDFLYRTAPFAFEPGLSILDVMMWNEPAAIRSALQGARIVPAISS